ncbi:phosphoglycolate phosphatase [Aeromonas sp. RU39B]|uniref:HAD-IA family hydrolase n=1 Tax=Aeromonas sp. RU39B TaxID=1907416 RepID=UPI00095712C4|nr:HAD-IA family hydrolase [Aeromonas sp. RU39B]SIQ76463.1 phosphoglycolate phosphatase [Aeromonas sp. RU39B]
MVRLAIFDWDGTLMDSVARIVACLRGAARDCGLPEPAYDDASHIIGLSLDRGMAELFALDGASDEVAALVERYRYHWFNDPTPSPLFEGAQALLRDWHARGIQLAVATGKSRRGLDRVLDESGLRSLFVASRSADETRSKPDPLMLTELLAELGCPLDEAVMIGDSVHDMGMAANCGMRRIGVTWGVHQREQLQAFAPWAVVDSLAELQALL